ncbi:MAG: DUF4349 domain-containing protein [Bacteroidota bacterium]
MKKIPFFLCLCLLAACQTKGDFGNLSAPSVESAKGFDFNYDQSADLAGNGEAEPEMPSPERKVIKTSDLRMEVDDIDQISKSIEDSLQVYDAFLASSNFTNRNYMANSDFRIRVPQKNFVALLSTLAGMGKRVDNKTISTDDVTEEYMDLSIRLKTRKAVRDRYVDILRNKAKTVEDVLAAEEKIRVIQEEIESAEGRIRFLDNRVGLSTINLSMYQKKEGIALAEDGFLAKASEAFHSGWESLASFAIGLIYIWPFLGMLIIALVLISLWRRGRKKRRSANASADQS